MYLTLIVPYIIHICGQTEGHQHFNLTVHFCHILDFQKSKDIWIMHIIHTAV
jgi:L-lysine 2,3-aminomutase